MLHNKPKFRLLAMLALLAAFFLVACGGAEEPTAEPVEVSPTEEVMEEEMEEPTPMTEEEMTDEEMAEEEMEEPTPAAEEEMTDEEMAEEEMDEEMMDEGIMMMPSVIYATSNPSDLENDAIFGLTPDLAETMLTFEGFAEGVTSVESIAFAADGTAYLTVDTGDGSGSLVGVPDLGNMSEGMMMADAEMMMSEGLTAPKGLYVADEAGLVLVADFGAKTINVYDRDLNSAFVVDNLGEGDRSVWDVYHDAASDTLFASGTDGTLLIYADFSANQGADGPTKTIVPADADGNQISVNLHGVWYYAANDEVILTDVGDAGSAEDGQLFVIPEVMAAEGNTTVSVQIAGPQSMLGNPVDVVFDGQYAYVAEKSNDAVLRFDDILAMDMMGMMGDASPSAMIEVLKAESVSLPANAMMGEAMMDDEAMADEEMMAVTSATGAADLRVALTNLLGEHVQLASSATGAALDGRNADFEAAAAALDENSVALSEAVGSVYGEDAGAAFLELWRTHIGFFVDYTMGAAAGDEAMMEQAREDLAGYGEDFAAFLGGANPNVDPAAIEANLATHVETLTAVIDAQAAEDHAATYANLREAYGHMSMTALALSDAISTQFPDQFSGEAASGAADLRVGLNSLLAEHTYLAAIATNAALDGREAEFEAVAAELDNNSVDLANAVGSVYGEDAGDAFLELWRSHIGFFVNYTLGAAADDQAVKDAAIDDLLGYRADFIAFLNGANPDAFTEAGLTPILTPHVQTLTAVIDAQAAENSAEAYTGLREAYAHMQEIADPLAEGIVTQFPDLFQ